MSRRSRQRKIANNPSREVDNEATTSDDESSHQRKPSYEEELSDDDEAENENELQYINPIFAGVLTQMKTLRDKFEVNDIEKTILRSEYQIFNELFKLIEKYEANLTYEDFVGVRKQLELFVDAANDVDLLDLLENDAVYAKEAFYAFFKLINLSGVQRYLKSDWMNQELELLYSIVVPRIFVVIEKTCRCADLLFSDPQRPPNYIDLLSSILTCVRKDLNQSDLSLDPSPTDVSNTLSNILSIIYEYSYKLILVPDLVKTQCLDVIIDEIKRISQTAEFNDVLENTVSKIIYNISRHDDGGKELIRLNAPDLIKSFANGKEQLICCMALALLATPEQIKKDPEHMHTVLDQLLKIVYKASVSSNYYYNGFHISEPLIVFVKLFNDDQRVHYILEETNINLHSKSNVEFFINLLLNYYSKIGNEDPLKRATCTALVNILWSISFQEKYKWEMKNANTKFKELIQNLAKETDEKISPHHYVPQYIENIKKAAQGLLVNTDQVKIQPTNEHATVTSTKPDSNEKPLIMISYSHEDTEFCKQLYQEMLKKGYNVWIDFKFLKTGDLWETIAAGMKEASVIICLMSEDYCKSKSCRLEATYALDKLQSSKTIIPVFLKKHELPGWLEIRTAVLKYVRFRDPKQLESDKLFELIDMIESSLPSTASRTNLSLKSLVLPTQTELTKITSQNQNTSLASNALPNTTMNQRLYQRKPIKQWNKTDIAEWFQQNGIIPELYHLCRFEDGYQLLSYIKHLKSTEQLQYQTYAQEFLRPDGITSGKRPLLLHEFTKFSAALQKLEESNK